MSRKPTSFLFALTLLASATASFAQTKAPEPDYTFSYNIGVVSDYRFRGLTQANYGGAIQGGVDFSHKSGLYLGAWASNVSWVKQFNGATTGDFELDLYGGYKGEITSGLGFDVGLVTYQYPGNNSGAAGTPGFGPTTSNANTTEFYAGLSYSVATLKYSRSLGDFLGFAGSNGSGYLDLSANFDLGNGLTLTPHIGAQTVANQAANNLNYTDFSLTLAKDFGNGFAANVVGYSTTANQAAYVNSNGNTNYLGKGGLAVGLKYSF